MRGFAPRAQADLDEAVSWLLDHDMEAAVAERLLTAVLEAAKRLVQRPLLGRVRLELLPDSFRFWSIPRQNLLLVYRVDGSRISVLRVLSTLRDLQPLLDDMPDEWGRSDPG